MQSSQFTPHQFSASVRFVRGYKYLDRCGETVIRLLDSLDPGWIPAELSPTSGNLKNHSSGMAIQFSSDHISFTQTEFISFEYFVDQACKAFDVVKELIEIKYLLAPSLQVLTQHGFEDLDSAEKYLQSLDLMKRSPQLENAMPGRLAATSFAVCSEEISEWNDVSVLKRYRIEGKSIIQEKQPTFDERLMLRVRLLPKDQQAAIKALRSVRSAYRPNTEFAVQISTEFAFETEISTLSFALFGFLNDAWSWNSSVQNVLMKKRK